MIAVMEQIMNDVDEGGGQKDCHATEGTASTMVADCEFPPNLAAEAGIVNQDGTTAW